MSIDKLIVLAEKKGPSMGLIPGSEEDFINYIKKAYELGKTEHIKDVSMACIHCGYPINLKFERS